MNIGLLFWIIWVLGLLFGAFGVYRAAPEGRWVGSSALAVWVELGLLGWRAFGPLLR